MLLPVNSDAFTAKDVKNIKFDSLETGANSSQQNDKQIIKNLKNQIKSIEV